MWNPLQWKPILRLRLKLYLWAFTKRNTEARLLMEKQSLNRSFLPNSICLLTTLDTIAGKAALVMAMPKITTEYLETLIAATIYTRQGRKTTICVLILRSKFEIVGSSACLNPEDFDEELGRKYAYEDAMKKLWDYEAYRQQTLFPGERRCQEMDQDNKD